MKNNETETSYQKTKRALYDYSTCNTHSKINLDTLSRKDNYIL